MVIFFDTVKRVAHAEMIELWTRCGVLEISEPCDRRTSGGEGRVVGWVRGKRRNYEKDRRFRWRASVTVFYDIAVYAPTTDDRDDRDVFLCVPTFSFYDSPRQPVTDIRASRTLPRPRWTSLESPSAFRRCRHRPTIVTGLAPPPSTQSLTLFAAATRSPASSRPRRPPCTRYGAYEIMSPKNKITPGVVKRSIAIYRSIICLHIFHADRRHLTRQSNSSSSVELRSTFSILKSTVSRKIFSRGLSLPLKKFGLHVVIV